MAVQSGEELRAWLRLLGCRLDRPALSAIVGRIRSPLEVLDSSDAELAGRFSLGDKQLEALRRTPRTEAIERQFAAMERHGIELVPLGDPDFPRNLFEMRTPPPAIFAQGRVEDFDALAVGIVGPRAATSYGAAVAGRLARDFAPTLTVVSGAALGIDSVAHEAVLEAGGRTIAVMGCGLDVNYPAGNELLRRRIADGNGALLSAYAPGVQPLRGNFPARNFILAGLCLAVVVVEASSRSGALVTARAAGEEGRPVYAVPGDITRRNSEGSNALLRDGAIACTSAADVIADMEAMLHGELEALRRRRERPPQPVPEASSAPAAADKSLAPGEFLLLDVIRHAPVSHDDLMARFVPERLSVGDLATALLMLEMKGRISQMPGRIYAPKL